VPMPLAVILDGVTAADDVPREIRIAPTRTRAKERGVRAVRGELL